MEKWASDGQAKDAIDEDAVDEDAVTQATIDAKILTIQAQRHQQQGHQQGSAAFTDHELSFILDAISTGAPSGGGNVPGKAGDQAKALMKWARGGGQALPKAHL